MKGNNESGINTGFFHGYNVYANMDASELYHDGIQGSTAVLFQNTRSLAQKLKFVAIVNKEGGR